MDLAVRGNHTWWINQGDEMKMELNTLANTIEYYLNDASVDKHLVRFQTNKEYHFSVTIVNNGGLHDIHCLIFQTL